MTLIAVEDLEVKVVRKVRTPAGRKRYGQEIGSIIVADGKPPLSNLVVLPKADGFANWDRVADSSGKQYDVGYDEDMDRWVATSAGAWDDIVVDDAESEEEVYQMLNDAVGGKRRKGDTKLGNMSKYGTERERQSGRKKQIKNRDQAKEKYGDRRKATYDKYVAASIINFDKSVKEGDWDTAQEHLAQMFEAIKARNRRDSLRADAQQQSGTAPAREPSKSAVQERAAKLQEQLEESAHFRQMKQDMEAHDAKERERLDKRVADLSKYSEEGPEYDRDIAQNLGRFHEAMAKLSEANTRAQRAEVIDRAKIHLQHAERRHTAKKNNGVVQHRLASAPAEPAGPPKPGEKGSVVRIGTDKVMITKPPRRNRMGVTNLGMEYLDRSYDVNMPSYQSGKSSKIDVYDETTGETEEGFLPPRDEVPGTPQERAEYANKRLSQIMNRLHARLTIPAKEQRTMTLQSGSKAIRQMPDGKTLTAADEQKLSVLKRHLDMSIAMNNPDRTHAVLSLIDETYAEYGFKSKEGPRQDIRKLRDAADHNMQDKPVLKMDAPNQFQELQKMDDWQLLRFQQALQTEMARVGNPTKKSEHQRAAMLNANLQRVTRVLAERG